MLPDRLMVQSFYCDEAPDTAMCTLIKDACWTPAPWERCVVAAHHRVADGLLDLHIMRDHVGPELTSWIDFAALTRSTNPVSYEAFCLAVPAHTALLKRVSMRTRPASELGVLKLTHPGPTSAMDHGP
jgi:hypothetical protein